MHPRWPLRRGKLQIVFSLLCDRKGRPVAAEVFEGNTADPAAVASQVGKLAARFSLSRVVLVGDRGLLTKARIREDLEPAGLRWITSLRAPAIRKLVSGGDLQLSLFDEQDLAEINAPKLYPGERLVVCRNPLLAAERARKREALLAATEAKLDLVVQATKRESRPLRGERNIAVRADRALRAHKVGKHFKTTATDDSFSYERNDGRISEEAALDGIYITTRRDIGAAEVVRLANARCDQENVIAQLKSGVGAMRLPVYDLESNWAYMVIAAPAWNLRSWFAMMMHFQADRRKYVAMEFRTFIREMIQIPCQVVLRARRTTLRIIGWQPSVDRLFSTWRTIERTGFT